MMKAQNSKNKTLITRLLTLAVSVIFFLPQSKAQEVEKLRNYMNVQGVSVNDYLVDHDGFLLIAGYINFDYAYLAKVDTVTRSIIWDTTYHADYCGMEAYNQYFDITKHPDDGYLVTKLIHECGTSNYEYKVIHVSKDGEFLKEGTTKNKGIHFPVGYGGNPKYRDLIIREDGHVITLMKTRYIGQKGNLNAIIEFDENLEFVKHDTSLKNHDVRLHAVNDYLYAFGRISNKDLGYSNGPTFFAKYDIYTLELLSAKTFDGSYYQGVSVHSAVFDESYAYVSYVRKDSAQNWSTKFYKMNLTDFQLLDSIEIQQKILGGVVATYDDFLVGTLHSDTATSFIFFDEFFNEIKLLNAVHPLAVGFNNIKFSNTRMSYFFEGDQTVNPVRTLHFFEIDLEELNLVATPEKSAINTEVRLFPNPSSTGNFELVSEERFRQINVFSMEGKLIRTYQHTGNRFEFSLNESGIYLIQTVLQNGDTQTFKAVKL